MTRDEFITAVILRTNVAHAMRWDTDAVGKLKEMQPFFKSYGPRYTEWMAARRFVNYSDFYEQAKQRKLNRHKLDPLNIHIYAVSAAVRRPEEASMILSLPLDAVHVLLDAGNPCVLMIYPMMRLVHDNHR